MLIRPVTPKDKVLLHARWAELQPEAQRRRFGDPYANVTLIAFTDDRRSLLGAAQYTRRPDDPRAAEMALVVTQTDIWERAGRALAETLKQIAHRSGIERFCAPATPEVVEVVERLAA
jgi:hypothetical protein